MDASSIICGREVGHPRCNHCEDNVWQDGGDDIRAKGGSRAHQTGKRWKGMVNLIFCGLKASFSRWLEAPTYV